ncbi:MAG: TIGR00366 family protein [Flavobacteriales bacterium]|nr:TIGR00366 family protein [Flavobacteriales bacterium]
MKRTLDALVIVAMIMVMAIGLTWIIPAGEFDRAVEMVNGKEKTLVQAGTYHDVDQAPQSFFRSFTAPLEGFEAAADIIAFVILVGGAFSILMATGAIDSALQGVLKRAKEKPGNSVMLIPVLMAVFALAGYSFGMSEETLVFVLITLPLARNLGFDAFVGVAIPFIGAGVGFAGAAFNPFTVGIAHGIADVQLFSGAGYRTLVCAAFVIAASIYVMRYARKLIANPEMRFLPELDLDEKVPEAGEFNGRRKLILLLFFLSLVAVIVGAIWQGWYIAEISGLFVVLGLLSAIVGKLGMQGTVNAFYKGAKEMLPAALVIALSKSILLIAQDGKIIDTILHAMSGAVDGLPKVVAVQLMFLVQGFINFFIPSGSGQAAITIPIMAPLGDLIGISRQTSVLAYQFGDGLFNLIIPTSGVTMGILSIAKIPFGQWLKWIWKLMVVLILLAMIFLALPIVAFEW